MRMDHWSDYEGKEVLVVYEGKMGNGVGKFTSTYHGILHDDKSNRMIDIGKDSITYNDWDSCIVTQKGE